MEVQFSELDNLCSPLTKFLCSFIISHDNEDECVDEFTEICKEIPMDELKSTCSISDMATMCRKTCHQCIPGNIWIFDPHSIIIMLEIMVSCKLSKQDWSLKTLLFSSMIYHINQDECFDESPDICNGIPKNELKSTCSISDMAKMCRKTCQQCIPGNFRLDNKHHVIIIFRIFLYLPSILSAGNEAVYYAYIFFLLYP